MAWKLFGYRTHGRRNPWRDAPAWAIELRNMTVAYNHAILTRLNAIRAGEMTPEQQRMVDDMYDTAARDVREMDAALQPDDEVSRRFGSAADMKAALSPSGGGAKTRT